MRILSCFRIFIVCFGLAWHPCVSAQDRANDTLVRMEQVLTEEMQRLGIPGLSFAVAHRNQLIHEQGLGLANVENSVAVSADSRFRTASVAKPMTAVVVLSLADDKILDLDRDITAYCRDYPKKEWVISSRHLLGHLAGVRHYKYPAESSSTDRYSTLKEALTVFADDPLIHEPGTKYLYSTFGYNLLGSVAEGASSQPFVGLLSERVWGPSQMSQTLVDAQDKIISKRVSGYVRRSVRDVSGGSEKEGSSALGELLNSSLHDTSVKIPGGGLLSTSGDLVRFAIAVNQNKLLEEATKESMWTAQKTSDGKSTGYGLGWNVGGSLKKEVWHTGGQSGTSTVLWMRPASGTVVAIMCNLQNVTLTKTARELGNLLDP